MENLHATPPIAAPVLVSVIEACRLTGLGRSMIHLMIGDGRLASVRIGKRRLVKYASIVALADGGAP